MDSLQLLKASYYLQLADMCSLSVQYILDNLEKIPKLIKTCEKLGQFFMRVEKTYILNKGHLDILICEIDISLILKKQLVD